MNNLAHRNSDIALIEAEPETIDIRAYIRVIWGAKWGILGLMLAVSTLVWVIVSSETPVYRSTATLLIEGGQVNVVSIEQVYGFDAKNRSFFDNQVQILNSHKLAEQVVDRLKLYEHPAFDPNLRMGFSLRDLIPISKEEIVWSEEARRGHAIGQVRSNLSIAPIPKTQLVRISFASTDRRMTYTVANAVGEEYINSDLEARLSLTRDAATWLTNRLESMRVDLERSERDLQAFRERENLIDMGRVQTLNATEVSTLNNCLLTLRNRVSELKNQVDAIGRLDTYNERWELLPIVLADSLTSQLRVEEAEAKRALSEISRRYGPKHPRRITAEDNAVQAQESYRLQVRKVVAGLDGEYQQALADQREIQRLLNQSKDDIQAVSRKRYELSQLEREVETNRQLYDMFFTRFKETDANQFGAAVARFVDKALPPGGAISPNVNRSTMLAAIFALIAGAGLALLRDFLDNTIRTPIDVEEKLKQTLIGTLPLIKGSIVEDTPISEAYFLGTKSGFAEAVRTVRTGVVLSSIDKPHSTVLVTSTVPGEGKTTVSMNLAFAMGQMEKVVLIDADMRRPSIADNLGLPHRTAGLSSVIAGTHTLKEAINTYRGIDVITAGVVPPNPLELLSSSRFSELLEKLGEHYDKIVIDSAPTYAVSDSMVLSRLVDGVLYVVKADETASGLVTEGVHRLARVDAHMIGVVLNRFNPEAANRYGKYGYNYSYYGGYHSYTSDDEASGKA